MLEVRACEALEDLPEHQVERLPLRLAPAPQDSLELQLDLLPDVHLRTAGLGMGRKAQSGVGRRPAATSFRIFAGTFQVPSERDTGDTEAVVFMLLGESLAELQQEEGDLTGLVKGLLAGDGDVGGPV